MLDIDKLKHKGMTKKEYRDNLLELISMVDKMPFVAVDQAVENITLFHLLVKELYRIDCEDENYFQIAKNRINEALKKNGD